MNVEYLTVDHLTTKDLIRIFSKVSTDPMVSFNNTPCWLWTASKVDGYGNLGWKQEVVKIHQLIYAWLVAPVPRGYKHGTIDHLCRRRHCCNPLHLEYVSHKINILRGEGIAAQNAAKTHCKNGHPFSGDNLKISVTSSGYVRRSCRICIRLNSIKYWRLYVATRPGYREQGVQRTREWRHRVKRAQQTSGESPA